MRIGSLFSGVGGMDLGLEWAGLGETVWQVEADRGCRSVLARHWPEADRSVTDVREATIDRLPAVDLVCGGFPCTDVSSAGARVGLAGSRSGLWFEQLRVINEFAPRWGIVENVASGQRLWLPEVCSGLEALGYHTAAVALSAADVGAPHLRRRVFVVAYHDGQPLRQHEQREPSRRAGEVRDGGHTVARRAGLEGVGRDAEPRVGGGARGPSDRVDRWPNRRGESQSVWEPSRVTMRKTARAARLKALGNICVPQCAEVIGKMVLAVERGEPWGSVFA